MSLAQTVEWDVESGGSDSNGGGFNTASSGTDRSQQTGAFVAFNGTTITATTSGISTTIVIAGYTVVNGDVGNILNVTGGTNFTTGRYEVASVNTSLNTWTLDRNATSGAGTGMTGNMGGCLVTIQKGVDVQFATGSSGDQITWVKKATFTEAVNTTSGGSINLGVCRVYGYQTSHGDNPTGTNRPTMQKNSGTVLTINTNSGWVFAHWIIDGQSAGATIGIDVQSSNAVLVNLKVLNTSGRGIYIEANSVVASDCEVTGCGGSFGSFDCTGTCDVFGCWSHDNTGMGFGLNVTGARLCDCVANGNTNDGFFVQATTFTIDRAVAYNNGRDGIRLSSLTNPQTGSRITNFIADTNAGYGINSTSATGLAAAWWTFDYNAFNNNTNGSYNHVTAGSHDVSLSGSPFTAAGSNDYTLNNTAGAGAACRSAGIPGHLNSLNLTGYEDIGTFRHQDPAGSGGMLYIPSLEGV